MKVSTAGRNDFLRPFPFSELSFCVKFDAAVAEKAALGFPLWCVILAFGFN